jgi:AcrR family transcriptional regulator
MASGNSTLTDLRLATTRQEIMVQAGRLFANNGIEATTMGDVAEALGITRATLYKYFPSKDELVDNALRYAAEKMSTIWHSTDATSMRHGLTLLARRHAETILSTPPVDIRLLYRVLLDQLGANRHEGIPRASLGEFTATARKLLEIGQENGELRDDVDLDAAVADLTAELLGLDMFWLLMPEQIDLHAANERAIERFLMQVASDTGTVPGNSTRNPAKNTGKSPRPTTARKSR